MEKILDLIFSFINKKLFIEVKNVTLSRNTGLAEFPDAVTSRGLKHIRELLNAKKGLWNLSSVCNSKDDCEKFQIAKDIDPKYYELLVKAVKKTTFTLLWL